MASKLVLVPSAEQEFLDAFHWYESRQMGLGQRFAESVKRCLTQIQQNPLMGQAIRPPYRWLNVRRFPYVVIFELDSEAVTVYSVFHCSRDLSKWQA